MEIITRPCEDVNEIAEVYDRALCQLVESADEVGAKVLGFGIQPQSAPSRELLTAKPRYWTLLEALGDPWLWFTVTASDQTHVAINRGEVLYRLKCLSDAKICVALQQ